MDRQMDGQTDGGRLNDGQDAPSAHKNVGDMQLEDILSSFKLQSISSLTHF